MKLKETLINSKMSEFSCEGIYIGRSIAAPGVVERCYLAFSFIIYQE